MKKFRVMVSVSLDYEVEAENKEDAELIAEDTWFDKMQFLGDENIMVVEKENE